MSVAVSRARRAFKAFWEAREELAAAREDLVKVAWDASARRLLVEIDAVGEHHGLN